jgi:hypothetical protein
MSYRPRLLVDFDGVLHAYSRGWADGTTYDGPIPGALEALAALDADGYEVVVFSTRDADQIVEWLAAHGFPAYRVTNVKEPAVAQIDDRAIRFHAWRQALDDVRLLYPIRQEHR